MIKWAAKKAYPIPSSLAICPGADSIAFFRDSSSSGEILGDAFNLIIASCKLLVAKRPPREYKSAATAISKTSTVTNPLLILYCERKFLKMDMAHSAARSMNNMKNTIT